MGYARAFFSRVIGGWHLVLSPGFAGIRPPGAAALLVRPQHHLFLSKVMIDTYTPTNNIKEHRHHCCTFRESFTPVQTAANPNSLSLRSFVAWKLWCVSFDQALVLRMRHISWSHNLVSQMWQTLDEECLVCLCLVQDIMPGRYENGINGIIAEFINFWKHRSPTHLCLLLLPMLTVVFTFACVAKESAGQSAAGGQIFCKSRSWSRWRRLTYKKIEQVTLRVDDVEEANRNLCESCQLKMNYFGNRQILHRSWLLVCCFGTCCMLQN